MFDNSDKLKNIIDIIENDGLILLRDISDPSKKYIYYDKYRILIPYINGKSLTKCDYNSIQYYLAEQKIQMNGKLYEKTLIKESHAKEIFYKLEVIKDWNITSYLWLIDNGNKYSYYWAYNGKTHEKVSLNDRESVIVLKVIYLEGRKVVKNSKVNCDIWENYGLQPDETQLYSWQDMKTFTNIGSGDTYTDASVVASGQRKQQPITDSDVDAYIQELLDCDKRRCGLKSYEQEMLYDIKAGHWDVFENDSLYSSENKKLVPRNPKSDIKENGIIGIDFGTRSTVVVKQEGTNDIRPIRVGSLSLKVATSDNDYENPTIISCMNVKNFLEKYNEKAGRPETSCDDFFVSYNAYNDYKNCPTGNFYAYYSDLKQWANSDKTDSVVQDINERTEYHLSKECSIDDKCINPIEIYAYYIGMYINNMRNGIYLKYIMSFPVKYSNDTKELIRKSFEKGLKKSLPVTILEDEECMKSFSVKYHISEPAAYAVTALEQLAFKPDNENEKYLYGIFDFGGGTTDFDFGVWRGASDDEYDRFNCDYVLECFGADSDVRLGGENILEMLAYHVFKENKEMVAAKKIKCARPIDQEHFIGDELLIDNSRSANRNLTLIKEALRPLWEQHDDWKDKYHKKNDITSDENEEIKQSEEYIELQLYDSDEKPVPNCRFIINTQQLIDLIKQRIQKGVEAFFACMEKSIRRNSVPQFASEKVYIFLAGNSSKSVFVKEIFNATIKKYNEEYAKIGGKPQERFELIQPLQNAEMTDKYIPNAKTSVAYGLIKSRPGGKIYIKKNYETDLNEETKFKYYLGSDKKDCFDCKLAPVIEKDGREEPSYNIWVKFQGAGMGVARIYYTDNPLADAKDKKLSIDGISFREISFEPDGDKYLFVRTVNPSVIEYAIADAEDEIGDIEKLNIDNA